jgi:hypothetical protein
MAWSCLVLVLFLGIWLWYGMPKGPEGMLRNLSMMLVISILAPPIVWIIGRITIG